MLALRSHILASMLFLFHVHVQQLALSRVTTRMGTMVTLCISQLEM